MAALGILVPSVKVRILAFQQTINTTIMNTSKTTHMAFSGFAVSLERAQRLNAKKTDSRYDKPADNFIGKMWMSPEEHAKLKKSESK